MTIRHMEEILAAHPAFAGSDPDTIALLAGCARNERAAAGAYVFREGDAADRTYILREGDVAVEIAAPGRKALVVETLHAGDMLGWGWMVPPHTHMSDARAVTDTALISLDATCLRGKCEATPALGYHMFRLWMPHLADRMRAQRLQLLDIYGTHAR